MKSIANFISISRIFLVLSLIFTKPLSVLFYIIYIASGISDILDGYIARKTNTNSKLGEKLDSVADLTMVVVLIVILYPIIKPTIQIYYMLIFIAVIRVASVILVFIKYRVFGMIHTYANKATGLMLFILPLLLGFIPSNLVIYLVCLVAGASAIEELFINLLSNEWQANKKSIFLK